MSHQWIEDKKCCESYLPRNIDLMECEMQQQIVRYVKSLDEIHKKALLIAKEHLGSSFDMVKSNGFIAWLHSQH
jgi:hypothetical protein